MKAKFKTLSLIFVLTTLLASAVSASEYTKNVNRSFSRTEVDALNLSNKYGTVTISDTGGESVSIEVSIVVESSSESKARQLLDQITIDISKNGKTVLAKTNFGSNFNTRLKFNVHYKVNIPERCDLDISNKYGNVTIDRLSAKGKFDIAYGNITAESLKAPAGEAIALNLAYSKADFQEVNNLQTSIMYSKLYLDKTETLKLDSKYSTISIDYLKTMQAVSKYDGFSIDHAGSIKAESKYTHYSIDQLDNSFVLNSAYGNIEIDEVSKDFETITIDNSYGGIQIGLDGLNYKLNAACSYCGIEYPQERFQGNREKDNQNLTIDGKVGTGTGTVKIVSRYGGIKLGE